MNNYKKILCHVLAISAVLIPSVSLANYKSDIIDSCTAYQQGVDKKEINACKLYIDGFIDSALLSENGAVLPQSVINKKEVEKSAYLKRAYQSWGFHSTSEHSKATTLQFCIPLEYNRKKVASIVAKSLDIEQLLDKKFKLVVLETLINNFPCKKSK